MPSELADFVEGTPGRFVPAEMRGELVEAEHLIRYWWAASLADGRRVLDAGCGMGYGSALLAARGAASVDAVDVAEPVVEAARAQGTPVRFAVGDVRSLPFPDDAFDLVVCFEVIEHIDDQARALDEFRRVLAPGGLLAVSSPNRDVYVPGNPHHVHELTPDELERELSARWPSVTLLRQHNFLATTLLADGAVGAGDGAILEDAEVRKLEPRRPGDEVYTVALAGDGDLPATAPRVTLTSTVEVRAWLERFDEQQEILRRQADTLAEMADSVADRLALLERLAETETELQRRPAMAAQLEAAESGQRRLAGDVEDLRRRLDISQEENRQLQQSLSWRVTRPLRAAKRLLG